MKTAAMKLLSGICVVSALVLVGCGGGSGGEDPLAGFRDQGLDWNECDSTVVVGDLVKTYLALASRVQCANVRVPLDYADPGRGEAVLALMRVAAETKAVRRGSILFNPGGPGADGLLQGLAAANWWSAQNPATETGALYQELLRTYDLVGFSPRGTGASTRLYCGSDERYRFAADFGTADPTGAWAVLENARLNAEACRKNPLTPYIRTEAVARDMDLVRHLLGDEKLNYYGMSYGTWLGVWYASLFPEHVGRMVHSGVVDFTVPIYDTLLLSGTGRQRVLDTVLAPYAVRHPDLFNLGTSVEGLKASYAAMPLYLRQALREAVWKFLGSSGESGPALLGVRAVLKLDELLRANPGASEEQMKALLAAAFVPSSTANDLAQKLAIGMSTDYFKKLRRDVDPVELEPLVATHWAVICNDSPLSHDASSWLALNQRDLALNPIFGANYAELPCLYWDPPRTTRPPLSVAASTGPVLMLQAQYDGLTPTVGARASFAQLPNASWIQVNDEYTHAILAPYGNDCVDLPIARYLLSGTPPTARETSCAGIPLKADR